MSRSKQTPTGQTNTGPDVTQLDAESLSATSFPAPRAVPFRVYCDPQVYGRMIAHASEDVSVEICGVLVGEWGRDADGPFVSVRNYIRCDSASKKFAEVTFTHESWSHINKEMDTKYQDQRIVGWYHSHPNFGIFLSDRDLFIQQNFFSGPGQIALVIDPVRKIEGVFEWRKGNAIPTPHFWVGDRVLLAPAGSGATGMPEGPIENADAAMGTSAVSTDSRSSASSNSSLMMLAGMGLFLMGWLLAGWRSDMDRRAIIEGTVAHFGVWKGLRPGLEEALFGNFKDLERIAAQLNAISADHLRRAKGAGEKSDEKAFDQARQDWKKVLESFDDVRRNQKHVIDLYAMSAEEHDAVRRYVEQKFIEISRKSSGSEVAPPSDREADANGSKNKASKASDKVSPADESKSKTADPKKK